MAPPDRDDAPSALESKHPQIAQQLRQDILRGRFALADKLPSNPELAKLYNVAPVTMRKALQALVDEKLLRARPGSGTFVRKEARKRARLIEIGILVEDILDQNHPYIGRLLGGLGDSLPLEEGYGLQMTPLPLTPEPLQIRLLRLKELCAKRFLDGFILCALPPGDVVRGLWAFEVPMVIVGRDYGPDYPTVIQDNAAGAKRLAETIRQRGWKTVCGLAGTEALRDGAPAEEHVLTLLRQACEAMGVGGTDRFVRVKRAGDLEVEGAAKVGELLSDYPESDALVVCGNPLVTGAARRLNEHQLAGARRPVLLPVTDDEPAVEGPSLVLPVRELGRAAGALLRTQLEGGRASAPKRVTVPMIWRESLASRASSRRRRSS